MTDVEDGVYMSESSGRIHTSSGNLCRKLYMFSNGREWYVFMALLMWIWVYDS